MLKKKKQHSYRRENNVSEPHNLQQKNKGKGIEVDQKGFQKVIHRDKGVRRNIFGNTETFMNGRDVESGRTTFTGNHLRTTIAGPGDASEEKRAVNMHSIVVDSTHLAAKDRS